MPITPFILLIENITEKRRFNLLFTSPILNEIILVIFLYDEAIKDFVTSLLTIVCHGRNTFQEFNIKI